MKGVLLKKTVNLLVEVEETVSHYYTLAWRKRGGTTGALNRRAYDRGERGERRRVAANEQGNTGTRPFDTEETSGHRHRDTRMYEYINKQQTADNNQQYSTKSVTTEQAGEQMLMHVS